MKKIRVLIVDDSASVRQALTTILETDPRIEVMATANDPFIAAERIKHEMPDVITLDVEMPRMDGITFLERLMKQCPVPVVMCSTLTERGTATALAALEKGAVEIIAKPKMGTRQFLEDSRVRICDIVRSAAGTRLQHPSTPKPAPAAAIATKRFTADAILPSPQPGTRVGATDKVVAIGASTGGSEALRIFLRDMPSDAPGIVIVQHMPELFTAKFAARLNGLCSIEVKEAEDGDAVQRGRALIAPGNKHLLLQRRGSNYYVELRDGPLVSRHRPSVDVLFRSTARAAGPNSVGIIMTGMGNDGANGLHEMHAAGAYTLAQDEESCVVFGMPAEAIKLGAVTHGLPLDQLAGETLSHCARHRKPAKT